MGKNQPGKIPTKRIREPNCSSGSGMHTLEASEDPGVWAECIHCGERYYLISETVMRKIQNDLPYTSELASKVPHSKN